MDCVYRGIMELRHLRYFAAVAQDLSFRRAARRLHLSDTSLSQQITDLENEMSVKLFKRNPRRVELTEAGRVFLAGARQTLGSAQRAVTQAQEVAKGERGALDDSNRRNLQLLESLDRLGEHSDARCQFGGRFTGPVADIAPQREVRPIAANDENASFAVGDPLESLQKLLPHREIDPVSFRMIESYFGNLSLCLNPYEWHVRPPDR